MGRDSVPPSPTPTAVDSDELYIPDYTYKLEITKDSPPEDSLPENNIYDRVYYDTNGNYNSD